MAARYERCGRSSASASDSPRPPGSAVEVGLLILHEAIDEREPVRVQPVGTDADEGVADGYVARPELRAIDDADEEADEVELPLGVDARHLGGLAAEERGAHRPAGLGQSRQQILEHRGVEVAGGHVVQEEERLRALDQGVVDAVVHDVVADAPDPSRLERQPGLRAHAVVGSDEDGLLVALEAGVEEPAESPDLVQDAGREGRLHDLGDPREGTVLLVDVDAGVPVGETTHAARPPSSRCPGRTASRGFDAGSGRGPTSYGSAATGPPWLPLMMAPAGGYGVGMVPPSALHCPETPQVPSPEIE